MPARTLTRCLAIALGLSLLPVTARAQESQSGSFLSADIQATGPEQPAEGMPPDSGPVGFDSDLRTQQLFDPGEVPFSERNFADDVLVLPSDHLFGDWWGLRSRFENSGISPSVTFVTDMLGNPIGGLDQGFTESNNLGINAIVDLEKRYGVEGGSMLYSMSQRSGNSLSNDYIGNTFQTQQVFGGPTFKVIDIAYRQQLADGEVEFRLGRIGTGDDFIVSPYNYLFVQNGFCGTPVGIFLNSPGMSSYPNATWGGLLKVRPSKRTYIMGGIYNGDSTIRDLDNHGLDFSLSGPPFAIAEFAYERNQLQGDRGLIGNYKFGAWYDDNDFPDLQTQALAPVTPGLVVPIQQGNFGFYGLADQFWIRFGRKSEGILRGVGTVASVMVSPDQSISQMPYFFTLGVVARGIDRDRPRDVAALGVVFGEFSSDLRAGQRQAQQLDPDIGIQKQEIAIEWTYIFRFRDGAYFLQPDMQYIVNPGGTGRISDALVVGTQFGINF